MTEADAPPALRRAAFVFIFITVLLDMLALGLIMPVLPKLVESFVGGNTARASEIFAGAAPIRSAHWCCCGRTASYLGSPA